MRTKLSLQRPGGQIEDIVVTADLGDRVGDIASAIVAADPIGAYPTAESPTLRILQPDDRQISPETTFEQAGLQAGSTIAVVSTVGRFDAAVTPAGVAAILHVVDGPDVGQTYPLRSGSNQIGRGHDADVRLNDPLVSKAHARVNVGEQIDIADLGSSNGIQLRGGTVNRAVLGPSDRVAIGDTTFTITQQQHGAADVGLGPVVAFNRSPRLDPLYEGEEFVAPTPPQPPQSGRFPIIPMIAPVFMAGIMFAITRNAASILFIALSPMMIVGSFFENRIAGKKAFEAGTIQFRASLKDLEIQLHAAREQEVAGRCREYPSTAEVVQAVRTRSGLLWTRQPDQRGFGSVRLGLGAQPTRHSVKLPTSNNTLPELWRELTDVPKRYAMVAGVPVVAALDQCGSIGIAAPGEQAAAAARGIVAQLIGLHSPAELVLCALVAPERIAAWEWLKWLPHATSDHTPIATEHLVVSDPSRLIAELQGVVEARVATASGADQTPGLPRVVVLVDDQASMDRADLVEIFHLGRSVGVHAVWFGANQQRLPAPCRTFLHYDGTTGTWGVGEVRDGIETTPIQPELLSVEDAVDLGRQLSPLIDAGAPVDDDSDVPRLASFLGLVDPDLASDAEAIRRQWAASHSLPSEYGRRAGRKRLDEITLRAVVGTTGHEQRFLLDLRTHGPHALVGGTTGSGKSEFLQTWVLGMATAHSPDRVNFLFVDYKGGAAFGECVSLPHSVGLVTDLSPHLVRRALVSLKAELKHREELFHLHKATDLVSFEKRDLVSAPPSLVIVVDEFAALAKEVPEFVEGVVDVAQRGRSLGLHLILATQRPAGVIKDNLRANTNLRIALRMADEADSTDVIGTKQAAQFDHIPGRGLAKLGPGKVTTFQTGYVGGWTTNEPPKPKIVIEQLKFGGGDRWEPPDDDEVVEVEDRGPNDLKRIVSTVSMAAEMSKIPLPRKPWQPELAETYELARMRPSRNDRELVFGFVDDPANQQQLEVSFKPDSDGNLAVFGTGGTGKSAFLRTLAIAAGLSTEGPCHVYGLDFGARNLEMLSPLPHVGTIVHGDDTERVGRLVRFLRQTIEDRSQRWGAVNAGSIVEYRRNSGTPGEPRILVLLDGFGAFRQNFETASGQAIYDGFVALAGEGRRFGIHLIISADRPSVVPSALSSMIQRRLVLRLAQDTEYSNFGVPSDALPASSPPGRGFYEGHEVQVAVLGGHPNTARQSDAIDRLADQLRTAARWAEAPAIAQLTDAVEPAMVPASVDGQPVLGIADQSLEPLPFAVDEPFLLSGPPQAQRQRYLLGIVQAYHRANPGLKLALFSQRGSLNAERFPWAYQAVGPEAVATLARELIDPENDKSVDGIVIEGAVDLSSGSGDQPLQDLVRLLSSEQRFVIAEADSNLVGSSYNLCQLLRTGRHGLALQPDMSDGDNIFRTAFPKGNRADYPEGRGLYVRHGRATKVQCVLPEST